MTPKEVISLIAEASGMSIRQLAQEAGVPWVSLMKAFANNDGANMKLSTFIKLIEAAYGNVVIESDHEAVDGQCVFVD